MVNQPDLLLEVPKEEHIADGVEFTLPRNTFEGVPENIDLKVKPEVVSIKDKDGNPITLKVFFHLSPAILDPATGQEITYIDLASFGQADPVRMWFFSIQVAKMLTHKEVLGMAWRFQSKGKLKLDQLLSDCLDASFFGNPDNAYYNKDNIYGAVKWEILPEEILNEIDKRISNNEPLNYQFLSYALRTHLDQFKNLPQLTKILKLADTEMERSSDHKVEIVRRHDRRFDDEYAKLNIFIPSIDFNIRFEGVNILEQSFISQWDVGLTLDILLQDTLISNIPAVNFTNKVINTITSILDNYYHGSEPPKPYAFERLPFITENVREVMIRRIYDFLKIKDEESDNESIKFLLGMTLGEFASSVCQIRLNNGDRNMRDYLKGRDDSAIKLLALKGES